MMTINEVSKLAGVSIRTLQYYDKIGLFRPTKYTEAGYRLYDTADLERLQQILLFRELEFPLKEIKRILESPDFDRGKALEQQIALLTMRKEHLENLIALASGIKLLGVDYMDFSAFDTSKIDEYTAQAKASWGNTPQYREFEEKFKNWSPEDEKDFAAQIMSLFREFGRLKETDPASAEAQSLVVRLQTFFTEHFYDCTDKILAALGKMYAGGGDFTKSIDEVGGEGTAAFANKAIQIYCRITG